MSARKEYFQTLLNLFESHIEATDERKEYELEEQILTFIEENPVPEPERLFEGTEND